MKKYIIFVISIVLILMTGCGKKNEIINAELAQSFMSGNLFTERLEELDTSVAEIRYGFNTKDYSEITAYVGTKSNCDEFVIIKTSNTSGVISKLNKYIEDKTETYKEYRPDEVYKLSSPLILEYNGTVVLVISPDAEDAKAVYDEYLKS